MNQKILFYICLFLTFSGIFYLSQTENVELLPSKKAKAAIKTGLKEGDIIFQTSLSGQGKAVQLATHSLYTHCGIIYKNQAQWEVYEAVQPVKITPLGDWISQGDGEHYVIKRLKNADFVLTAANLAKMKEYGKQFKGKNYDLYFGWSDERIYCSELVWKIYKEGTGVEVGKLRKLKDFDLTSKEVKAKMAERYGDNVPYEESVVSPEDIFKSDLLELVKSE
jgi:uncharacterized protein YycO